MTLVLFTTAVLITGGFESAEIYLPNGDSACVLPDLPDYSSRQGHTQDGLLLCGGYYTTRSCRRWNTDTGAWDLVTESLTEKRWDHISWTPADGSVTYLMGGYSSDNTSDVIDNDGSVRASFPMRNSTL